MKEAVAAFYRNPVGQDAGCGCLACLFLTPSRSALANWRAVARTARRRCHSRHHLGFSPRAHTEYFEEIRSESDFEFYKLKASDFPLSLIVVFIYFFEIEVHA
jgi:hypothetical protein